MSCWCRFDYFILGSTISLCIINISYKLYYFILKCDNICPVLQKQRLYLGGMQFFRTTYEGTLLFWRKLFLIWKMTRSQRRGANDQTKSDQTYDNVCWHQQICPVIINFHQTMSCSMFIRKKCLISFWRRHQTILSDRLLST